ncbi:MAG: diaminobutyrate--2-oxoglutarate transaminase [Clostridia bacterium]|nr:diaminobutyrate--2-oxoglutarate transaminase [Clostridia bacterium]
MTTTERIKSNVRYYSRKFPAVFSKAKGCYLYAGDKRYLDFFAGAGAVNYGHNNDFIKQKIIEYVQNDGIIQSLDMDTVVTNNFLEAFSSTILEPRKLDYKVMFPGPTGTNAVEAALKLAKKVTGRAGIVAFSGSFHGMTAGSMAVSYSRHKQLRGASFDVKFAPYPFGEDVDTIPSIKNIFTDDHPAAVILETVQAEGGVIVPPEKWLRDLAALCKEYGVLLICDDVQVGCGRTGTFFSFERAGVIPDIVALSKSVGGYGLPVSLLLFKSEYDVWTPGEHNGTFRANQLSLVGATAALSYYKDDELLNNVRVGNKIIDDFFDKQLLPIDERIVHRGVGLIHGFDFSAVCEGVAERIREDCFSRGLIIETCGKGSSVLKLLPPLVITKEELENGLFIIRDATKKALGR